jgi:hypothetical protein
VRRETRGKLAVEVRCTEGGAILVLAPCAACAAPPCNPQPEEVREAREREGGLSRNAANISEVEGELMVREFACWDWGSPYGRAKPRKSKKTRARGNKTPESKAS